ncbi:hypothetical protein SO802_008920 [Lithocarpus litseifolius]|uniref:Uncharacterized protein n=1 Tax=Lithocarpus litseifolius TaxID=425828 RepID=A0AAW2DCS2_9ROSI
MKHGFSVTIRNEVKHGDRKKSGLELVQSAKQYLQGFNEANVSLPKLARTQVVDWASPSASRYKVNVDRAVFASQKTVGVGVLIRDSHRQVVAAMSKKSVLRWKLRQRRGKRV